MDFVNALKNELNTNVTENGSVGYKSTNSILLDFNYKVPSMRRMDNTTLNKEIDRLLDGVEDKEVLFRYIFYLRDVRGGMGERRVFRAIIKRMAERRMKEVVSLIPLSLEKLSTPFIKPIVPILIRSSLDTILESYFLTICATNLKLCSINLLRESISPIIFFFIHKSSSSNDNGSKKTSLE